MDGMRPNNTFEMEAENTECPNGSLEEIYEEIKCYE